MNITVVPSWGDKVGAGLQSFGEGIYAGAKAKAEADKKDVSTKDLLDKVLLAAAAGISLPELGLTKDTIRQMLSITPPEGQEYTGDRVVPTGAGLDAQLTQPQVTPKGTRLPTRMGVGEYMRPQVRPQGIPQVNPQEALQLMRPQVKPLEAMIAKQTGLKTDAMAEQEIYDEKQKKKTLSGVDLWQKSEGERNKELSDVFGKSDRIIKSLSNLVGYGRAMDEDIKVPKFLEGYSGAIRGAKANLGSFRFASDALQKETKSAQAYRAQTSDLLTALTPILSGQARWVQGLAEVVAKSVPNESRITEVREEIVAQTARSILSLGFAAENGFLTDEVAKKFGIDIESGKVTQKQAESLMESFIGRMPLTNDQEEMINFAVDYILNTPQIRGGKIQEKEGNTLTTPSGIKFSFEEIK